MDYCWWSIGWLMVVNLWTRTILSCEKIDFVFFSNLGKVSQQICGQYTCTCPYLRTSSVGVGRWAQALQIALGGFWRNLKVTTATRTCVDYQTMSSSVGVLRKGSWNVEEDNLPRKCVEMYGEGKWHLVPLRAGTYKHIIRINAWDRFSFW